MNTSVTTGSRHNHAPRNGIEPVALGSCLTLRSESRLSQITINTQESSSGYSRLTNSIVSHRDQILLGCTLLASVVAIRSSDRVLSHAGFASLMVALATAGLVNRVENVRAAALQSGDDSSASPLTDNDKQNIQLQAKKIYQNISKHALSIATSASLAGVFTALIQRSIQCQQFRSCNSIHSGLIGMAVGISLASLKVLHQHGANLSCDKLTHAEEIKYFPLYGFEIGMSKSDPWLAITITFIHLFLYAFPQDTDEASSDDQSIDQQSIDQQSIDGHNSDGQSSDAQSFDRESTASSLSGNRLSSSSLSSQDTDAGSHPYDEESTSPANFVADHHKDNEDMYAKNHPWDEESTVAEDSIRQHPALDLGIQPNTPVITQDTTNQDMTN